MDFQITDVLLQMIFYNDSSYFYMSWGKIWFKSLKNYVVNLKKNYEEIGLYS